jgi:hypothetical protein
MEILGNDLVAESGKKVAKKYYCEKCDYECYKLYNWNKHLDTAKHNQEIFGNDFVAESGKKVAKKYSCQKCEKYFHTNAGLWKHNSKCLGVEENYQQINKTNNNEISQETILSILKQNSELQHMLIEQNKTIIELSKNNSITYSNNNNNSNNKTFNLQFFLNETCKDAMNIMDFIDSIKLQLSDLERVGELGYVDGISNIIVKNLKELDITQRPVHCTDKKRDTLYIKDENKWEKDEEKKKMHKVIKKVADKNARLLPKFKEAHPDCNKSASRFSDQYNKIIVESMGGPGDNDFEKEEKIIKRITKEIIVEK